MLASTTTQASIRIASEPLQAVLAPCGCHSMRTRSEKERMVDLSCPITDVAVPFTPKHLFEASACGGLLGISQDRLAW